MTLRTGRKRTSTITFRMYLIHELCVPEKTKLDRLKRGFLRDQVVSREYNVVHSLSAVSPPT